MASQQPVRVPGAGHREPGVVAALRDRPVPGGVQRYDLLHGRGVPFLQLEAQLVGDEPGFLGQPAVGLDRSPLAEKPGARRQGDPHV